MDNNLDQDSRANSTGSSHTTNDERSVGNTQPISSTGAGQEWMDLSAPGTGNEVTYDQYPQREQSDEPLTIQQVERKVRIDGKDSTVTLSHIQPTEGDRAVADEHHVSNYQPNIRVFATPGIGTTPEEHKAFLLGKIEITGRRTDLVSNPTQGFARDLWNSFWGIANYTLGRRVEPESTQQIQALVLQALDESPDVRVILQPHSQGSIITSNALFSLRDQVRKERGEEAWLEMASRIKVEACGAACHVWPEGIDVVSHAHNWDLVSRLTPIVKWLKIFSGSIPRESQIVKPVYLENTSGVGAHDAAGYVKDYDRFYIASLKKEGGGALADALYESIVNGEKTDHTHHEIFETIVIESDERESTLISQDEAETFRIKFKERTIESSLVGDDFVLNELTMEFLAKCN